MTVLDPLFLNHKIMNLSRDRVILWIGLGKIKFFQKIKTQFPSQQGNNKGFSRREHHFCIQCQFL